MVKKDIKIPSNKKHKNKFKKDRKRHKIRLKKIKNKIEDEN